MVAGVVSLPFKAVDLIVDGLGPKRRGYCGAPPLCGPPPCAPRPVVACGGYAPPPMPVYGFGYGYGRPLGMGYCGVRKVKACKKESSPKALVAGAPDGIFGAYW